MADNAHLYQLLYLSKATAAMSMRDALRIADRAQERNAEDEITGLLCFGGGYFLQVLEGEHAAVNRTFHRVAADPRHSEVLLVDFSLIRSRTFGKWSMRLINLDKPDHPTMGHRPKLLADDDTHPFFTTDPRMAFALLLELRGGA